MFSAMRRRTVFTASVSMALLLGGPGSASASALSVSYYTLSSSNPDVDLDIDGVVKGLVNPTLGPDGLPVVSALSQSLTGSGHLNDTNGLGELLWWTPHAGLVTAGTSFAYPGTLTLPIDIASNFYPNGPGGSDGGDVGFLSAHLQGTFDTPAGGTITMSLGGDDDAWVFIDGNLVDDLGGVHPLSTAPVTSDPLSAGTHTLDIFFADRHIVQAGLVFDANLTLNPLSQAPEPATCALIAIGLAGLGISRRRKRQ